MPAMQPPGMPPGGPPPGMGAPPPAQPPLEPDQLTMFLGTIDQLVESKGKDEVRDMLSALSPDILDELYRLIDTDVRAAIVLGDLLDPPEREPMYPGWYVEPPKPTETEIKDAAALDQGIWQDIADEMRDDLLWYNGEHPNTFKDFDRKKEDYFYSSAIRDDSDAKIAILGNAPIMFEITYTEQEFEEPTQKAENALYYWQQCWASQYAAANAGRSLRHDVEWYREVMGWIFVEVSLDLDGGRVFQFKLHDPTTCVPTFDEHGLARMTRVYADTVAGVIASYDDKDGNVRKAMMRKLVVSEGGKVRPPNLTEGVTVTLYLDRAWRAVYVNDIEIIPPTKHGYGVCPVIVGGSGLSEPMSLSAAGALSSGIDPLTGDSTFRLRYKNPSGFRHRKRQHAQEEAVKTKLFNLVRRIDRPDYIVEQDEYAEGEGVPQIKHGGNAVTPVKRGHEELKPLLSVAPPDLFTPLFQTMDKENATSRLPLAQHGVAESANQSGNATEGHIEAGKDKFAVQLQAAEVFWGQWAGMCLQLYRDFGHLIKNEKGDYGRQKIPYGGRERWRYPDRPPAYELTPEMLDHVGTEVEARLTSLRLQNLGPLGNAVGVWKAQRAMSSREGMELRGVRDPDMVFDEIDYEETLLDPDVQKIRRLQVLRKRDPELASLYEKMVFSGGQGGQSGPPQPPGGHGFTPNTSGIDLQSLGMGQAGPTGRPGNPMAQPVQSPVPSPGLPPGGPNY